MATAASEATGSPWTFIAALGIIVLWGVSGPVFGFSDTWQLVINTGTTIITFLMVFLVQNTQNRDAKATHLKLDELLRAIKGARTGLVNLESLSDEDLAELQQQFERLQDSRAIKESIKEDVKQEVENDLLTQPRTASAL
ncbi:MAG TPA: low affinity iron permease family protein [Chloroflexota bacterium]|nr:low affinity iron permease family protein [Chloroflexota bacterium]